MSDESSRPNRRSTRRRYLVASGAAVVTGIAGCLGGDDEGDGDGNDGSDENDDESDGEDGSSDGDDGSSDGDDEYPEWDPNDPQFPQLVSTLLDADFQVGSEELLESMEPRDEPRYGSAPPETPEDSSDRLDPDVLEFSMVPTEDPAAYEDIFDPLVENLEAETGKSVEVNPLTSYAAQVEAMNADRLHVAGFSTGATAFAVNIAGAVPFGMQVNEGRFGYKLWVITQADGDITSLDDLAGADITHVEESSNSGHQAPSALFTSAGVEPGEDYEYDFSGSHENSIRAIDAGDYDAAPVASSVLNRQVQEGHVDGDGLKVVWSSDAFPTTSFCYNHKLEPELQEGIERAHLEYDYAGTSLDDYYGRDSFTAIDYATHWDVILEIQQQNGVDYNTDGLDG